MHAAIKMSEDEYSDPFEEPTVEICIETLTGTAFEMKMSPNDTVLNIKNKIQRVEGMPSLLCTLKNVGYVIGMRFSGVCRIFNLMRRRFAVRFRFKNKLQYCFIAIYGFQDKKEKCYLPLPN